MKSFTDLNKINKFQSNENAIKIIKFRSENECISL